MSESEEKRIQVVVAIDFSDAIMEKLRDVSDRYKIDQYFPEVPEDVWAKTEILYTVRHFPEPSQAPLLRWIQLNYAGVEGALKQKIVQVEDVEVTSASGVHSTQIANYCLMMILAFHYQLPKILDFQQKAQWADDKNEIFKPVDLSGKTVGIVGYGSIGRELARIASSLGMTILASKRNLKQLGDINVYEQDGIGDPEGEIPERMYPAEALASMVKECDYVVLTVPLTPQTRHMVNEDIFDAMKKTAVLINISRGGVVDEEALISALAAEKIRGAALDVFQEEPLPSTSPLWNLENIIISPHISGLVSTYHEKAASLFAENLRRYLEGEPLLNRLQRDVGY